MSPDYPPQTIVDSPWKEGEYLLVLVEQPRLSLSATLLANWPCHFWIISSPFLFSLFPPLLLSLPCFSSPFLSFFFISWKGYRFEGIKGTRESKGPFVEIHLWPGLELLLERAILEDQEKAGVVPRRAFVESLFFSARFRDDQRWIWYYKYRVMV